MVVLFLVSPSNYEAQYTNSGGCSSSYFFKNKDIFGNIKNINRTNQTFAIYFFNEKNN